MADETWCGRVVEGAPEDRGSIAALVRSWVEELAVEDGDWFVVELDPGRLELGWVGHVPTSVDAPRSLTPGLFPGGEVPASYPALLAVGSAVWLDAWRAGAEPSVPSQLAEFYEVLVDAADRADVLSSAAAWLRRSVDAGDLDLMDEIEVGTAEEPALRRWLARVRPDLDADVEAMASRASLPGVGVRTQLVARAAHAHATRLWGSGGGKVLAEAAVLDALAARL